MVVWKKIAWEMMGSSDRVRVPTVRWVGEEMHEARQSGMLGSAAARTATHHPLGIIDIGCIDTVVYVCLE